MRREIAMLFALIVAACAGAAKDSPPAPIAGVSQAVLDTLPKAAAGKAINPATPLSRIAIGSCHTPDKSLAILSVAAAEKPDLFVYMGDNVYGDAKSGDASLPELRKAYDKLAESADFKALRASTPMLAVWDDHDYGMNDAGGDFRFKFFSERIFETFWGSSAEVRGRPGVYDAQIYGPPGQRVQIILLDTRFFRTALTPTDEKGAKGKERWLPSADPKQNMLGETQWKWLEAELQKPAELRLIVSSIQVLADAHGWEAWREFPKEQARLYRTLKDSKAKGVVLLSGDRHAAAMYKQAGLLDYPLYELTSSSLNLAFAETSDEKSTSQIGAMYTKTNFGLVDVDWAGRSLRLQVKDEMGALVQEQAVAFAEIGL